ncbi:GT2 family glycosyltransferase [Kineococcus xinjiangensis]|uniref:GT2 family glycosyltransferase n=1 Tax=Kineococcus xinjiangensis TaxID=512762 RepID=A0A2S6IUA9_9ACTN|nr:glycosyltransferase [Kineococcus xinjiangensis]PPK97751.1 GT2 family glycosyltransferase [Kineococcus xinjiangensis]
MPSTESRATAPRVVAVVVAHDRRELLLAGLAALAGQTRRPDAVVVVDNASSDGSAGAVEAARDSLGFGAALEVLRLERNTGGAGGFAAGLARAVRAHAADLVWLMDDDTVPRREALAAALAAREAVPGEPPAVVASRVVWTDGREHPMNTPRRRPRASRDELTAAAAAGGTPVRSASFVAILVDAAAVRADGLPVADFFLWNDDFEYTTRLLRRRRGLAVAASTVEHRTRVFGGTDADPGERFVLEVRNKLWTYLRCRTLEPVELALYGGSTLRRWARTIARSQRRGVLLRGLAGGLAQGLGRAPRPTAEVLAGLGEVSADVAAVEAAAGRSTGTAEVPVEAVEEALLPPFSVLLPVWAGDEPAQLRRALASVTAEQELRPAEVVVVRDGPVPAALQEVLDSLGRISGGVPVRVLPLPRNVGLARALEEGLAACAHDVVARMDADDISLPHRFAVQLPLLAGGPGRAGADLVGAGLLEIGRDEHDVVGRRTPPTGAARIAAYARFHDPFNHPTVVYRRSAVAAAGGYRDLPLLEDYWLFARMIGAGAAVVNVAEPLVLYRVGSAGAGSYARRGGLRLWRSEVELQAHLRREGFTTGAQWARNVAVRGGYRFVPEGLRRVAYRRLIAGGGVAGGRGAPGLAAGALHGSRTSHRIP